MVTTKLCGAEVFDEINKDPGTYNTIVLRLLCLLGILYM